MKLYQVQMEYNGCDPQRSDYHTNVFKSHSDTDAEAFAKFLAMDWKDSTIRLGQYTPTEIPSGYTWGDTGPGLISEFFEISRWEQPE